jgi:hypothetical protein
MNSRDEIQLTAGRVVARLKAAGVHVMRLDAKTSNSVYLKLDRGLAGTIRISDHPCQTNRLFRYNLIKSLGNNRHVTVRNGKRYDEYPLGRYDDAITYILAERKDRIHRRSIEGYMLAMDDQIRLNAGTPGFWTRAKEV